MGVILAKDSFKDPNFTLLQNHVPEAGGSWAPVVSGAGSEFLIHSRCLTLDPLGSPSDLFWVLGPSVADCYVQAKYMGFSPYYVELVGRMQPAHSSWVGLKPTTKNNFLLTDYTNSVSMEITWTPGMVAKMVFSGTNVKAYFDGVIGGQITTAIGAGKSGFYVRAS